MRNFINLIKEDENTNLDHKLDLDMDFEPMSSKGELTSSSRVTSASSPNGAGVIPGKMAGKRKTRSSMKKQLDPEAHEMLRNLHKSGLQDTISDLDAAHNANMDSVENVSHGGVDNQLYLPGNTEPHDTEPHDTEPHDTEPHDIEHLPIVLSQEMTKNDIHLAMNWHMVRHLENYKKSEIRALGRLVFEPFTSTDIEDIQVLSTLSNSEDEVKAMAIWLKHHAVKNESATIKMFDILPGYHADIAVYDAFGYEFMFVKDMAGFYIYAYIPKHNNKLISGY